MKKITMDLFEDDLYVYSLYPTKISQNSPDLHLEVDEEWYRRFKIIDAEWRSMQDYIYHKWSDPKKDLP